MSTTPPDEPWSTPPPPPGAPPGYPPPPPPGYGPPGYGPPGYDQGAYYGRGGYGAYPPGATPSPYAGWWQRVGATVVDSLLVGVPVDVIFGLAGASTIALGVISALVTIVYQILMIGSGGRTVGNRAVGTVVVDANTGGQADYGRIAVRAVVQAVLNATVIGGIVDGLWPLWDVRNQTLHDKAAATFVLRQP
ncbi:MAG TPA: RDD family protein [Acidimicrobiia bacterium]|nr:RDD family protein [Acidimicrobiia bacterium]